MRELFIYYRLHSIDAAAAHAAVQSFQAELRAHCPGLIARLLRRPEATDGCQTWMETYATDPLRDPAGVSVELQAEIETRAGVLGSWIAGPRHAEVFIACDSQACQSDLAISMCGSPASPNTVPQGANPARA